MDVSALALRLGIGEEDFLELIDLFVTTSLADIEKVRQALAAGSSADAAAAAHSVKGAAGNLGLDDMYNLAKDMEMQAKGGSLDGFEALTASLEQQVKALNAS